jgi:hypothetical protein
MPKAPAAKARTALGMIGSGRRDGPGEDGALQQIELERESYKHL